jgi:hypothetical protein
MTLITIVLDYLYFIMSLLYMIVHNFEILRYGSFRKKIYLSNNDTNELK